MSHQVQYAPFQPSLLSSPHPHPSSSDLPSSPTTSSFYQQAPLTSLPRSTSSTRPRLHKSQSSTRTNSVRNQFSSSPSTTAPPNPFRQVHENARLQRAKESRVSTRDLGKGETSLIPDEPGGWTKEGEWEEFDPYEREKLELEMIRERKEWKYRMRLQGELAEDHLLDPEDEDQDEMEEEPPLDILLSDYSPPHPSPLDPSNLVPSLASSLSSSPFLSSSTLPSPSHSYEDTSMSLSTHDSLLVFKSTILSSPCPRHPSNPSAIQQGLNGVQCAVGCGWGIESNVLEPLAKVFARHGDASQGHLPLLTWTEFTGTLVLCQTCDEQFAA